MTTIALPRPRLWTPRTEPWRLLRPLRMDSWWPQGQWAPKQRVQFEGPSSTLVDSYTKLLLHCDGSDASTTFTDSSPAGHTVTANGNAQIDTAQSKFGGASALFDGTGDYLTISDHDSLELGAGEFTLEAWVRFASTTSTRSFIRKGLASGGTFSWGFEYASGSGLVFNYSTDGTAVTSINKAWSPSTSTWYHVVALRTGTTLKLFVDGTQVGTDVTASGTFYNGSGSVSIGATSAGGNPLNGWLDEIRVSKGVARWTTDFTPPTSAY